MAAAAAEAAAAAAAQEGDAAAQPSPDQASSPPLSLAGRKVKLTTTRRHLRHTTTPVFGIDSLLSLLPASGFAAVEAPARLGGGGLADVAGAGDLAASEVLLCDSSREHAGREAAIASEPNALDVVDSATKASGGAVAGGLPVVFPKPRKRHSAASGLGGGSDGSNDASVADRRRRDDGRAEEATFATPPPARRDGGGARSQSPLPAVAAGDARRQCSTSSRGSSASTSSTTSGYHSAGERSSAPGHLAALASQLMLTDADLVVSAAVGSAGGGCSVDDDDDDGDESLYQTVPELTRDAEVASKNGVCGATGLLEQQQPSATAAPPFAVVLRDPMTLQQRWCDMPQVKACGVLEQMSATETRLQEAMFELLTSETSYLHGLDVLMNVFVKSAALNDDGILPLKARQTLFCNVDDIYKLSQRLHKDLEQHWQDNIVMFDVCDILARYASEKLLDVYIKYCSNQAQQHDLLESLRASSPKFVEAVRELELHPSCRNLNLSSYLLLPMQRITRYPLLVDAIMRRLEASTQHELAARRCYGALKEIVRKCNEVARLMDQAKQLVELEKQLRFTDVKKVPIVSASRRLIKRADFSLYVGDGGGRIRAAAGTLTSRILAAAASKNKSRTLFLFSDLVLIAKKKSSEIYSVVDYASRAAVTVDLPNASSGFTLPLAAAAASDGSSPPPLRLPLSGTAPAPEVGGSSAGMAAAAKLPMLLVLLQNHQKKHAEYVLVCQSESERERWLEALAPASPYADDERIYESWDCPQVRATSDYITDQADELLLHVGDVVNVNRKMNDGWYEGERISDGCHGWFPSSCTEELPSEHRRVKHLKQRYEVLKAAAVKLKAAQIGDPPATSSTSPTPSSSSAAAAAPSGRRAAAAVPSGHVVER